MAEKGESLSHVCPLQPAGKDTPSSRQHHRALTSPPPACLDTQIARFADHTKMKSFPSVENTEIPFCQHGGVLGVFLKGIHAKPAARKRRQWLPNKKECPRRQCGRHTLQASVPALARPGGGAGRAQGAYRGLMGGLLLPAVIFIRSKWLVYSCVCVAFSSWAYIWPVRRGRLFLL